MMENEDQDSEAGAVHQWVDDQVEGRDDWAR